MDKNPDFIKEALKKEPKPKNLTIILSSPYLNKVVKIAPTYNSFVDKTFTVFSTKEEAAKQGKKINCGGRSCKSCMKCYKKTAVKEIIELLK